jgi:tRNA (cmo5U34)-methyltransferase
MFPFRPDEPIEILDLGAGTSLLAGFVAERFPATRLSLIDFAPEMVALARTRLAPVAERVRFVIGDYVNQPFEEQYHAIVSALSIHHMDDDGKRRLFRKINAACGAEDGSLTPTKSAVQRLKPSVEIMRNGCGEVHVRGIAEGDLSAALKRMKHDRTAPLYEQLQWLASAGFRDVDCVYQNGMFAVYGGSK